MRRGRRDARAGLALALSYVLAGSPLLAGCSKSPKPSAEVPVASADTLAHGKNGTGEVGPPPRTTVPVPAPPKRTPAPKPASDSTAKNGTKVSDVQVGSSTSSPAVVPQLTVAEMERLEKETKAALEQAQKMFDAVDSTKLDSEKNRKYVIAKDFLAQAGAARGRKEYERAQALALKARLLTEEIATH